MSDDRHRQSRPRNRGVYPCGLARWHSPPGLIPPTVTSPSTFLRSLRSRPVTALLRYYGRSDSCPSDSETPGFPSACSTYGQVSLIHALSLPAIPSPPTCGCSALPRHVTCRQVRPRLHPNGTSPQGNSGLHHSLADSPHHTGRIEFVILRSRRAGSPPAAPHPIS